MLKSQATGGAQAADFLQSHLVKFNMCNKTPLRDRLLPECSPGWQHESAHKQISVVLPGRDIRHAQRGITIREHWSVQTPHIRVM